MRVAIARALQIGLVVALESGWCSLAVAQTRAESAQTPASGQAEPSGRDSRFTWAASERARYSGLFNQFRPGLSGNDQALVFRTTLRGEFAWPHITAGAEVHDARAYLTDQQSNLSTALVNAMDLLQAYVLFGGGPPTEARVPEVQIGRFGMELGSGRLIAQEAYRDVTRAFTGARLRWRRVGRDALTAFAVLPVWTRPESRDALLRNRIERDREHLAQKFWGALYERERLWRGTRGEAYMYALREQDDPGSLQTRDRRLWTVGGRVFRPTAVRRWDLDAETAWQRGSAHASSAASDVRPLGVSARLLHLQAGYTFARTWSPRLAVEYDYGSGDSDPADGRWNRFDGLFGNRRVDLGPTSIYGALGRENIVTPGVRASVAPTSRIDALAVYRVLRLAAPADAFASTGVRDPAGLSGRAAGQQVDLRLRTWIVPGRVRLDAGATRLIAGSFLRRAPNATHAGDATFFYGDVTYTLGSKPRAAVGTARP